MENLNNGWIHRESRLPAETDGDSTGKVFAWHAYQGVMLTRWDDFPQELVQRLLDAPFGRNQGPVDRGNGKKADQGR